MAGDDAEAVAITERLVRDAGFDPVYVGPLSSARRFDRGTDVYVRGTTAAELRQALNLQVPAWGFTLGAGLKCGGRAFRTRREYIPVGSATAIRPPWMAEVQKMQEHFSAMAQDGRRCP